MYTKIRVILVCVMLFALLCGCNTDMDISSSPSPMLIQSSTPEPVPSTETTPEPEKPSEEPTDAPSDPQWNTTSQVDIGYDDYFSEIVEAEETVWTSVGFTLEGTDYNVSYDGVKTISVFWRADGQTNTWRVPKEFEGYSLFAATNEYVYLLKGTSEIVRTNWYGEQMETIFVDSGNALGVNATVSSVDSYCVFFVANSENGVGVYRFYVPTETVDLLVELDPEYSLTDVEAVSNHQVRWYSSNPEFEELVAEYADNPEWEFFGSTDDFMPDAGIEKSFLVPHLLYCAYNSFYDESFETGVWIYGNEIVGRGGADLSNVPEWW